MAFVQFVVASCVCIWYFSKNKGHFGFGTIRKSIYYAIRYHLGSLAFGSFLLATVRFIKWYLLYLEKHVYKAGLENKFVKILCKCVQCYIVCLERFIKFIDKNAYIQIALTGNSFCVSAKNGFILIIENAARFAALGSLGEIFTFLGKVFITVISSFFGYLIITKYPWYQDYIENPIPPTVIFVIISYLVAGVFMGIYDMTCDTILQAFLVDEKRNAGRDTSYAPAPMKKFMKKHRSDVDKQCCGCI